MTCPPAQLAKIARIGPCFNLLYKYDKHGCIDGLPIGSPESRVFILVALARVNASNWFNIMTRLASFYRK